MTWTTSHGDLHWANITAPALWLFDWEAWGLAPFGIDAATLLCFSLQQPQIVDRIYHHLGDWLNTPVAQLSQLFVCSERLRMTELYNDHPDLAPYLAEHAKKILKSIPH